MASSKENAPAKAVGRMSRFSPRVSDSAAARRIQGNSAAILEKGVAMNWLRRSMKREFEFAEHLFGQAAKRGAMPPVGSVQRDLVRPGENGLPAINQREEVAWAAGSESQKEFGFEIAKHHIVIRRRRGQAERWFNSILIILVVVVGVQRLKKRLVAQFASLLFNQRIHKSAQIVCERGGTDQIVGRGVATVKTRFQAAQYCDQGVMEDIAPSNAAHAPSGETIIRESRELQ